MFCNFSAYDCFLFAFNVVFGMVLMFSAFSVNDFSFYPL